METKHIMLVEDDVGIIELVSYLLKNEGYKVTVVNRGDLAEEMIEQISPNLILLDITLPGLDGIELCRRLRRKTNVPIIFLTSSINEHDEMAGLNAGGDDYITKPFNILTLLARIKAHLRRS